MPTKISELDSTTKSSAGTHNLVTANGGIANYKLLVSELFPSLTTIGNDGQTLLSLANQNVFSQKTIKSANNLLTIATVSNELVYTVNAANINLSQCNNTTSLFLTTVNLATNVTGVLPVANGGTGLNSFAQKSVLITTTVNTLSATSMSTNGSLLIGGVNGPAATTLTAGTNVTIANGNNSITINAPTAANVATYEAVTNNLNVTGDIVASKSVQFSTVTEGIEYTTKATVTQTTNLSTGVTINAAAGKIVTFPASLNNTQAEFTVTNSAVTSNSLILLTLQSPGIATEVDNGNIIVSTSSIANGSFKIVLSNPFGHASDASGRTIHFLIIN